MKCCGRICTIHVNVISRKRRMQRQPRLHPSPLLSNNVHRNFITKFSCSILRSVIKSATPLAQQPQSAYKNRFLLRSSVASIIKWAIKSEWICFLCVCLRVCSFLHFFYSIRQRLINIITRIMFSIIICIVWWVVIFHLEFRKTPIGLLHRREYTATDS